MIVRRERDSSPESLGARWTHATDLLAHEARRLSETRLTPLERRRAVRRIQSLERVARRAMHDYRVALERQRVDLETELTASLPPELRVH
jgi:hypothetical protein